MKTLKKRSATTQSNGRAFNPRSEIARLFPEQGSCSVKEYLAYSGNRLVEFDDGFLEFLPMPTTTHNWIISFLLESLKDFSGGWSGLGLALFAGIRVRLWEKKFREPDVVFMLSKHKDRAHDEFWEGADLVMEVVSGDSHDRKRDLITKRSDYARARIPEYWIVDPKLNQVTVLRLKGKTYEVHGLFKNGQSATSRLLPGFSVSVDAVLAGP